MTASAPVTAIQRPRSRQQGQKHSGIHLLEFRKPHAEHGHLRNQDPVTRISLCKRQARHGDTARMTPGELARSAVEHIEQAVLLALAAYGEPEVPRRYIDRAVDVPVTSEYRN